MVFVRSVTEDGLVDYNAVIDLYVLNGWSSRAEYDSTSVKQWCENSTFAAVAYDTNQRLVGLVRVLSDGYHDTWIPEIVVHPNAQRQGIGGALMAEVIRRYGHTAIYGSAVNGSEMFFNRFGIIARPRVVTVSRTPS